MLRIPLASLRCTALRHSVRSPRLTSTFSTTARVRKAAGKPEDKINYNPLSFEDTPSEEQVKFKHVTANDLERSQTTPTEVKMLARDFIEDSLYNPHYGYFPKQVTIFTTDMEPIDFSKMRTAVEFQDEVAQRYSAFETDGEGPGRQIWHTPTELFKPWYGQALAQCLVSEYLLKYFPYEDFVIYEIGAGNGTLARDILDYLREVYPDVYDRTRYNIIEISGSLAKQQRKLLCEEHPCVTVNHKSIFKWDRTEPAPCFFLAMEVIDNFAHDMIRYDLRTLEPYQGLVTIDKNGDFGTFYTKVTDPLISSFLGLRNRLGHYPPIHPLLKASPLLGKLYTSLPFAPNLSPPEFIPTRLLTLLRTLRKHFPRHRLLLSDFSTLPDTIPGYYAPVVQTRVRGTTVACETLLVKQGYFDIFFPTDFERLRDMYEHVLTEPTITSGDGEDCHQQPRISPLAMGASPLSSGASFFSSYHPADRRAPVDGVASATGLPVGERKSNVFTHAEFMKTYADMGKTKLKSGENPMVEFYQNVKFLF